MFTDIVIIVASISAAILFLYAVTSASEAHSRKESNDFTGAVVAVIGTTYAVLLAFMLSNVWGLFQQAQVNAEQEANDVVNVYRIGSLLQEPARQRLQQVAREYAQNVVNTELPSMSRAAMPPEEVGPVGQMWTIASELRPRDDEESQALGALISTLRSLTEHRRIRIMQGKEALPGILWLVLIAGGIITVAASCFFGVPSFRFHLLQVVVLSFLISLVLVAIAEVDSPYRGQNKVAPVAFEFALHTFSGQQ